MFAATLRFEQDERAGGPPPGCASLPRSSGAVDLRFVRKRGISQAERVFQRGVMRARFPNLAKGHPPEAVLINTAGGLTGGDELTLGVRMGCGTSAVVTTQAHEKVYRSALGEARFVSRLRMDEDAVLEWLPQPTILFDGARLRRETHVELPQGAVFLGVESMIFGRTAMGEAMHSGALSDFWTVTREGRLVHADRFALSGDVAANLARPWLLAGNAAMATIRYIARDAADRLEGMRAMLGDCGAASAWNGMLLARIAAADGYLLNRALTRILTAFRGRALPAVWSI